MSNFPVMNVCYSETVAKSDSDARRLKNAEHDAQLADKYANRVLNIYMQHIHEPLNEHDTEAARSIRTLLMELCSTTSRVTFRIHRLARKEDK